MADGIASPVHFALAIIVFFLDLLHDVVLNAIGASLSWLLF